MRAIVVGLGSLLIGFAFVLGAFGTLAAGAAVPSERTSAIPLGGGTMLFPVGVTTSVKSINWGGYAVTGPTGSISNVVGSWVEPKINQTCHSALIASSFWVGIDGYSSTTVEQTGTDVDCQSGHAVYYAWYEFYPAASVVITSVPIKAGDHITGHVSWAVGKFTAKLTDNTTGKSFSITRSVSGAARTSAEWIAEAPSTFSGVLPLTNFGTVKFSNCSAKLSGTTHVIGGFPNVKITMWNKALTKVKAQPSALLSSGSGFTVKWKSAGP